MAESQKEDRSMIGDFNGLPAERFAAFTEHFSGGVVITDPEGRIQWTNAGFARMTGYSAEELLGEKPGSLLQGPGTNPETVRRIHEHLKKQESFETELVNYTKQGKAYTLYLKVDPIFDPEGRLLNFIGFQTDVTHLRRQSELMRSILESAHHAIVSLDISGRIETFNSGAERFLGYSEQEALNGLDPLHLYEREQLKERASFLSRSLQRTIHPGLDLFRVIASEKLSNLFSEWTYITKEGRKVYGELALSEMRNPEGRLTGYLGIIKDRTDLHAAEKQLEDSSKQLSKLARQLPGVIYQYEQLKDGGSRFPYASEAMRSIYGVAPEEVKEDATAVFEVVHPEDQEKVAAAIKISADQLTTWEQEYRVKFKDGTVRWLYGYANPERLKNGNTLWHGFITDISDRKDNESRLQESEERLTMALEATQDGVWDWDIPSGIVFWSPRCYDMLGYENGEFTVNFEKWKSLLHPADLGPTLRSVDETLVEGLDQLDITFRLRHRDGSYRWIAGRGKITRRDEKGRPVRMVGTHLDITEKKQQDEALRNANRRLEETNRQLELSIWHANELARQAEAANDAKSSFIANMSHEIRTPMTSILGYADLLSEQGQTQENAAYLPRLKEAGHHLMAILNDILDISRIESGRMDTEETAVSPVEIIDQVSNMLRGKAEDKGLEFRREIQRDMPEFVLTDGGRLRQILLNLAGNSVKFTETGYVLIQAGLHEEGLFISVEDTGIGISPRAMKGLFQPFNQGDSSFTRRFGGSGLGLAISQRLAQMLGGKIEATSEEGKGSVFTLILPLKIPSRQDLPSAHPFEARVHPDALVATSGQRDGSIHAGLQGMKVLVVEDDPDIRIIVSRYLQKAGIEYEIAESGKQALDITEKKNGNFHCILMDIQMPDMDGKQTLLHLRRNGYHPTVVAMTAHALSAEVSSILEAGFDDYLAKPINKKTLYECLRNHYMDGR